MSIYHDKLRVEFSDTDAAGIVHFANFFRYMERVEHSFWRSLGLSVQSRVGDHDVGFPRVKVECEFAAPARFEDELDVAMGRGGDGEHPGAAAPVDPTPSEEVGVTIDR